MSTATDPFAQLTLAHQAKVERLQTKLREQKLRTLLKLPVKKLRKEEPELADAIEALVKAKREKHDNALGISKKGTRIEVLKRKIAQTEKERNAQVDRVPVLEEGIAKADRAFKRAQDVVRKKIDPNFEILDEHDEPAEQPARKSRATHNH